MSLRDLISAGKDLQSLGTPGDVDAQALDAIQRMRREALAALMLQPLLTEALETIRDRSKRLVERYPAIDPADAKALGAAVATAGAFLGDELAAPTPPEPSPAPGGSDLLN